MLVTHFRRWLASKKRRHKKELALTSTTECRSSEEPASSEGDSLKTDSMFNLNKSYDRLPTMFVKDCGYIPLVLTNAAAIIEKHIKTKYLFQTQGLASRVSSSLNQLSRTRVTKVRNATVHDVIEALKAFLVRLPEPLLPDDVCEALIAASEADSTNNYHTILEEFRKSAPHHFAILHFMMRLLHKVSLHSNHNYMDVRKLATIFVLDVIKPLNLEDSNDGLFLTERMQRLPYLIMVIENLIGNVSLFQIISSQQVLAASLPVSPSSRNLTKPKTSTSPPMTRSNCEMAAPAAPAMLLQISPQVDNPQGDNQLLPPPISDAGHGESIRNTKELETATNQVTRQSEHGGELSTSNKTDHSPIKRTMADPGEDTAGMQASSSSGQVLKGQSPQKAEPSPEGREIGTQAGQPQTRDLKLKKCSPLRAFVKTTKSSASTAENSAKTPTKKRPASGKGKGNKPASNEVKLQASVDRKHLSRAKAVQQITLQMKRKKKGRVDGYKKTAEPQPVTTKPTTITTNSADFAAFHPDEEIAPWNDTATNSDDTSVMTKTIRNPRILSSKSTKHHSKGGKQVNLDGQSNKRPRGPFPLGSEEQNVMPESTSESSTSYSQTLLSREDNDKACLCQSLQYVGKEVATLSEELMKGIHVKTSVDITADKALKTMPPTGGASKRDAQHCHNKRLSEMVRGRPSSTRDKYATTCGSRAGERETGATGEVAKRSTDCPRPDSTTAQQHVSAPLGMKEISGFQRPTQPCQQHMKLAISGQRQGSILRCQQSIRHSSQPGKCPPQGRSHSSLTDWCVDIFLICITLFCTGIVFYIHHYRRTHELVSGT